MCTTEEKDLETRLVAHIGKHHPSINQNVIDKHARQLAHQITEHLKAGRRTPVRPERFLNKLCQLPDGERLAALLDSVTVDDGAMNPDGMASESLALYLAEHRELYAGKVVVDMGCGCGIQGLVMACNGAKRVIFIDRCPIAVTNTQGNIQAVREQYGDEGGHAKDKLQLPALADKNNGMKVWCGNRFVTNGGQDLAALNPSIGLVVYNHPFFPYEPLDPKQWPAPDPCRFEAILSMTMMAEPKELKTFLASCKVLNAATLIMPFFTLAGENIEPEHTNDPAWHAEPEYVVTLQESRTTRRDDENVLQAGRIRIYELRRRTAFCEQVAAATADRCNNRCHLMDVELDRGDLFERLSWGRLLAEQEHYRPDLALPGVKEQEERGDMKELFPEGVFFNLCSSVRAILGKDTAALIVYYATRDKRFPNGIVGRGGRCDCERTIPLNVLYDKGEHVRAAFDPTHLLLQRFTRAARTSTNGNPLPPYLTYTRANDGVSPGIKEVLLGSSPDVDALRNVYSYRIEISVDTHNCNWPNSTVGVLCEHTKEVNSVASEEHKRGALEYLKYMTKYFDGTTLKNVIILPLWAGNRREPLAIGSLILFCYDHDHDPTQKELLRALCVALNYLQPIRVQQSHSEMVYQAQRAAIAAVMGRNMSHNLGSHVLAGLDKDAIRENLKMTIGQTESRFPVEDLMRYLQQRMDFVARVATTWPTYSEPTPFANDLLRGFVRQNLLLKRLVQDNGVNDIVFNLNIDGKSAVFRPDNEYSLPNTFNDMMVAIPGGMIGRHAFYAFLENAIRNAARHGVKQDGTTLTVYLELRRSSETSLIDVVYWDSMSTKEALKDKNVEAMLEEPLVDPTTLERAGQHWGIQEMKVCVQYLLHPRHRYDGRLLNGVVSNDRLEYSFQLQMPVLVCEWRVGGDERTLKDEAKTHLRSLGVAVEFWVPAASTQSVDAIDNGRTISPGQGDEALIRNMQAISPDLLYVVASTKEAQGAALQFIERARDSLPFKILINGAPPPSDFLPGVYASSVSSIDNNVNDDEVKEYILVLNGVWLSAHAQEVKISSPLHVLVYFERNSEHLCTTWRSLAGYFEAHPQNTPCRLHFIDTRETILAQINKLHPAITKTNQDGNLVLDAQAHTLLVYDNHQSLLNYIEPKESCIYQHIYKGKAPGSTFNHTMGTLLENISDGWSGEMAVLRAATSAILRVLVIDERIARAAWNVNKDGQSTLDERSPRGKQMERAWISVPLALEFNGHNMAVVEGQSLEALYTKSAGTWLRVPAKAKVFDAAVIHIAQLERLRDRGVAIEKSLELLRTICRRVVLTSGRGRPNQSECCNLPFLEFAALESSLLTELSKISLGNALIH